MYGSHIVETLYGSNCEYGSQNIQEQIGMDNDRLEPTDAVRVNGVSRRRQRTEKGKAYIAHLRWTDCHSIEKECNGRLTKLILWQLTRKT